MAPGAHLLLLVLLAVLTLAHVSRDLSTALALLLEPILLPVNCSAFLFACGFFRPTDRSVEFVSIFPVEPPRQENLPILCDVLIQSVHITCCHDIFSS